MPWLHQCRPPGTLAITLKRARAGAEWQCPECDHTYTLRRKHLTYTPGAPSYWYWEQRQEPEEPDKQGAESHIETSWQDHTREDGERVIPEIRLGFQKE